MSDIEKKTQPEDHWYSESEMDPNRKLYVPLLESLGVEIEDRTDRLMVNGEYAMVDDLPLVLASNRRVRSGDLEGVVTFHPLSENISNSASGVHSRLCQIVANKLSTSIGELALSIGTIAANPDLQKELSPSALTVIKTLEGFDQRALKRLVEFIKQVGTSKDRQLVRLNLRRGYNLENVHYHRTCSIRFPILDELFKEQDSILGGECRKKDPELLRRLFMIILPKYAADAVGYHGPSNSPHAPYFDAILEAYIRVATDINKVVKKLSKSSEINPDTQLICLDWQSQRSEFEALKLRLPPLPGNSGAPGVAESKQNAHALVQAAPPAAAVATVATPAPFPQPTPAPAAPALQQAPIPPAFQQAMNQPVAQPGAVNPLFYKLNPPGSTPAQSTTAAQTAPPAVPFGPANGQYPTGFQQPASVNNNGFLVNTSGKAAAAPVAASAPAQQAPATPNGFSPQALAAAVQTAYTPPVAQPFQPMQAFQQPYGQPGAVYGQQPFQQNANGFPVAQTPNGFPVQPQQQVMGFQPGTQQFTNPVMQPYASPYALTPQPYPLQGPQPHQVPQQTLNPGYNQQMYQPQPQPQAYAAQPGTAPYPAMNGYGQPAPFVPNGNGWPR